MAQAANAGSAGAAETLAAAYHYGVGVVADRQKALAWYELAAARGSALAQAGLQRLSAVDPVRGH
ncbi:MAG: SEL1-like repeat protein [Ahniella sp.]|nr:SEL1-like repeat protein [Ahniella sp.]